MKTSVLIVAVFACLVATTSVLARRVAVPVDGKGRHLIVDASINQRVSGRFLVDTGATHCVISKQMAKDVLLSGRNDGEKIRVMTANGLVEATMGEARRIDVGDAVARDVPVAILDNDPIPGLDGLIGLSFLQRFKYSVDSDRGVLMLEN